MDIAFLFAHGAFSFVQFRFLLRGAWRGTFSSGVRHLCKKALGLLAFERFALSDRYEKAGGERRYKRTGL
jgi:hypothetical protein